MRRVEAEGGKSLRKGRRGGIRKTRSKSVGIT